MGHKYYGPYIIKNIWAKFEWYPLGKEEKKALEKNKNREK